MEGCQAFPREKPFCTNLFILYCTESRFPRTAYIPYFTFFRNCCHAAPYVPACGDIERNRRICYDGVGKITPANVPAEKSCLSWANAFAGIVFPREKTDLCAARFPPKKDSGCERLTARSLRIPVRGRGIKRSHSIRPCPAKRGPEGKTIPSPPGGGERI